MSYDVSYRVKRERWTLGRATFLVSFRRSTSRNVTKIFPKRYILTPRFFPSDRLFKCFQTDTHTVGTAVVVWDKNSGNTPPPAIGAKARLSQLCSLLPVRVLL